MRKNVLLFIHDGNADAISITKPDFITHQLKLAEINIAISVLGSILICGRAFVCVSLAAQTLSIHYANIRNGLRRSSCFSPSLSLPFFD